MADTGERASAAGRQETRPFLYRVARRFYRLPGSRRMLLVQAVLWLALARLALIFIPFRTLAGRFGTVASSDKPASTPPAQLDESQLDQARAVGWAVTRAARYVPFRAVCLPQAIAAQAMLSRRRIASVMHFGVMKKPGEALAAHAWLNAGPVEVTGYPVGPEYVEVARFL